MTMHQRNLVPSIAGLLGYLCIAAAGAAQELLPNTGFERKADWGGSGCTFEYQTSTVHDGSQAGMCYGRQNSRGGVFCAYALKAPFLLKGSGDYTIGAWMRLASGSDEAVLALKVVDDSPQRIYKVQKPIGTGWTYVSGTVRVDFSEFLGQVTFAVYTANGTADFYVDDCSVTKGTTGSTTPLPRPAPPAREDVPGPDLSGVEKLEQSDDYRVWVNGQEQFVYKSTRNSGHAIYSSMSFVNFDCSKPATVKVYPKEDLYDYAIRPHSYNISSKVTDDGMITFSLGATRQVVLAVNGSLDHVLVVCANPIQKDPGPGNVTHYYGPGVHHVGRGRALASGDTVYIADGAVVEGGFCADDHSNIRIFGRGVISCGEWGHREDFKVISVDAKTAVPTNCVIEGITMTLAPGWIIRSFCGEDPMGVLNLVIRNVKQIGNWHYNTDGVQIGRTGFLVENCFMQTNDDSLSMNEVCRNGEIRDCIHWVNRNGGVYTLGWGCRDIRNLYIHDNVVLRAGSKLSIKSPFALEFTNRDASVRDIFYKNIVVEEMTRGAFWVDYRMKSRGKVGNIVFDNITIHDERKGSMSGHSGDFPIDGVTFNRVTINGRTIAAADEANLTFKDVKNVTFINDPNAKFELPPAP